MSPRLAVGDVSIANEGSAPCPPGSTMSPPNDGALVALGAGGFAVALGAANTAAPASAASKNKRFIEVVLPRRIHTTRSRCAATERPGYNHHKRPANMAFLTDESVKRSGRGKRGGALPAKRPPRQSPPQGDEGLLSDLRRSQTRAAAGRVGRYDRRMPFAVRILIAWAI